ncbi:MAG: ABC transporter ATP-binding protein, partial [Peptococcaceae bacterium]
HPQVLFLDEPTLGLDPQTRSHIWQYIHELREREQITIFLTTHYMDEAEHCGRIAIIDHGEIVALDTPAGLKQLVGGDIVWLATGDDRAAARDIAEKFGLAARTVDGVLQVEVKHGESFIPRLIEALPCTIREIGLRKPTLDDVFLKLTGRAIRPEEAGAREQMKYTIRAWRGRR